MPGYAGLCRVVPGRNPGVGRLDGYTSHAVGMLLLYCWYEGWREKLLAVK